MHPESCTDPDCTLTYREHLVGISIGAEATPTRTPDAAYQRQRTRAWSRDMDAYARLRREGLRPRRIDGAARMEATAATRGEIE